MVSDKICYLFHKRRDNTRPDAGQNPHSPHLTSADRLLVELNDFDLSPIKNNPRGFIEDQTFRIAT